MTLESDGRDRVRLRVGEGVYVFPTDWQRIEPGEQMTVTLVGDTARDEIEMTFGDWSGVLPLAAWNPAWDLIISSVAIGLAPVEDQLRMGVGLTHVPGDVPALCNRLRDRVDD